MGWGYVEESWVGQGGTFSDLKPEPTQLGLL